MSSPALAPGAVVALLALAAACSAPATLPDLAAAEQAERAGRTDEALAAYQRAQRTCQDLRPPRRRQLACAQALLGAAELREQRGDPGAADAYERAARAVEDRGAAAQASYKAGALRLAAGDAEAGWRLLWRTVTDFPDEAHAADALALLVEDGRRRDPRALLEQVARVLTALGATAVADNLLWVLADLSEHELADPRAARAALDRLPDEHPTSGLRDDARWHAARISRQLGDAAGAATRLRALLATREVAFGAGSYFSVWLDDAQLELGRVLRDDLADLAGARAAFTALGRLYPASTLRDDAELELAVTAERAGDRATACRHLATLATRWPETRAGRAGAARAGALACAGPAAAAP
ncbi:MAG: tetratricopeptide repeat protein [Kofleriaceae bacterium]|nr:tetratricopeptide repeat protein [Kofleriaceae bacterium]